MEATEATEAAGAMEAMAGTWVSLGVEREKRMACREKSKEREFRREMGVGSTGECGFLRTPGKLGVEWVTFSFPVSWSASQLVGWSVGWVGSAAPATPKAVAKRKSSISQNMKCLPACSLQRRRRLAAACTLCTLSCTEKTVTN